MLRAFAKTLLVLSLVIPAVLRAETPHEDAADEAAEKSKTGANLHLLGQHPLDRSLTTRPSKVTLESPEAFAKIQGGTATLKWTESKGADSYHVQVATDPNFKWLIKNENFYKGTTMDLSGLEAGKQYFWRVAGMKADNQPEYLKGFFTMSSFEAR
jgi:hypothetical protein